MGFRVEEVEYLKLGFLKYLVGSFDCLPLYDIPHNVVFTGSGRAALRIILEHCVNRGILQDRNEEVLIPQWLCQSVVYTMHRFCHPTLTVTKKVKAVMAYHQYGFPQNMDEVGGFCSEHKLYLIEDCAHAYESYYKGRRLGTFGDAALLSFSKFLPSVLGGGLVTQDGKLLRYAKSRLFDSRYSHLTYASRLIFELAKNGPFKHIASDIQEMSYAKTDSAFRIKRFSLRAVAAQLRKGAMEKRKANYKFIINYFDEYPECFSYLEKEGVSPYVVPLFAQELVLKRIVKTLLESSIYTGIYHFDVNRSVLNPCFKKCLWIPVHQGLSVTVLERICALIKKSL